MLKYYKTEIFKNRIKECSGIICIGVGKMLNTMLQEFKLCGISNKIIMLTDNNINKQGESIDLGNKVLKVVSVDKIKDVNIDNIMIIITPMAYHEILEQLSKYCYFDNAEIICFIHTYAYFLEYDAMSKEIPIQLKLSDKPLIPKKIHYCWFGKNPIPNKLKEYMKSWKKFCPDYEIIEWNESNYDITKNKYMYQAYKAKKWAFVSDYARLDLIYKYGGIYLDTDVELVKNLDHLLYQKGFAGFETREYVATGLGFGAKKGLPIIKIMRDYYDNIDFIDENSVQNLTPCPIYQTDILKSYGFKANGEYQIISDLTIYPQKMFCPKSYILRLTNMKPYTCSIHHFDASWLEEEERRKMNEFEKEINNIKNNDMRL